MVSFTVAVLESVFREKTHLGQRNLAAASKKGPRIAQQRLNLFTHGFHQVLEERGALLVRLGRQRLHLQALDLGEPGVNEEGDAGTGQGAGGVRRGREERARVGVGEELRDDGRLGDDFAIVGQGGHEAPRVDLEVLWGARSVEVDDFFFKGLHDRAKMWMLVVRRGRCTCTAMYSLT